MRITNYHIGLVSIPLARQVYWVGASESANETLVLRIETDCGPFGIAQKKFHPAWSGMNSQEAARQLRQKYLPRIVGMDPLRPETIWADLESGDHWSSCFVLIDIALHDLAARQAGLPMWKYLGGWSDEVEVLGFNARGKPKERLDIIADEIERFGFRGYKIKIGGDPDEDVDFVRQLRAETGDDFRIRVDANGGYEPEQALQVARKLADLGVEDFEDPCDLNDPAVRRQILAELAVPLVVDNVIQDKGSAARVLNEGVSRMAIKVSRVGYRHAHEILLSCRAAQCRVIAGSMTENALGALGALHFYAAFPDFAWSPSEESYFAGLSDDVNERPAVRDGRIKLPASPGLGPDWDAAKMEQYSLPVDG